MEVEGDGDPGEPELSLAPETAPKRHPGPGLAARRRAEGWSVLPACSQVNLALCQQMCNLIILNVGRVNGCGGV